MQVKRTYGSRQNRFIPPPSPSSPPSTRTSSPPTPIITSRKRPLERFSSIENLESPAAKKYRLSDNSARKFSLLTSTLSHQSIKTVKTKKKEKSFTQLHFIIDQPLMRTCALCDLSYTRGAPDDEALHKTHCAWVRKGLEWGKEEEKAGAHVGSGIMEEVVEVETGVRLKDGQSGKGRIICVRADIGGKVGKKLTVLLDTMNRALSAPALTPEHLRVSKAYLFLLPSATASNSKAFSRERIVGCVIAQSIETAMAIATPEECRRATQSEVTDPSTSTRSFSEGGDDIKSSIQVPIPSLVTVDPTCGLFCHPQLLPTPMGIPRLFVPSAYRRQGIARRLLNAAARTFVHGYVLDPSKGEVAFTQPTDAGRAVMMAWGGGGARVYEE